MHTYVYHDELENDLLFGLCLKTKTKYIIIMRMWIVQLLYFLCEPYTPAHSWLCECLCVHCNNNAGKYFILNILKILRYFIGQYITPWIFLNLDIGFEHHHHYMWNRQNYITQIGTPLLYHETWMSQIIFNVTNYKSCSLVTFYLYLMMSLCTWDKVLQVQGDERYSMAFNWASKIAYVCKHISSYMVSTYK